MYHDVSESWLDGYQQDRVFGAIVGSEPEDWPLFRVEIGDFPAEAPNSLFYIATYNSYLELAAFEDYTQPASDSFIWVRIIDEDVRGWDWDDLCDELFGLNRTGVSYALLPEA